MEHSTSTLLIQSWVGVTSLIVFSLAYLVVIFEEKLHIRK